MRKTTTVFTMILVLGFVLTTISCKKDVKKENTIIKTEKKDEKDKKEYTSAYVCPMHCEGSGSDKEGTCPKCEMDYVKNKDYKEADHKHE